MHSLTFFHLFFFWVRLAVVIMMKKIVLVVGFVTLCMSNQYRWPWFEAWTKMPPKTEDDNDDYWNPTTNHHRVVPRRVGNGVDEERPIPYPTTPRRRRRRPRDRPCLAANVERSIIIIVATAAAGAAITNHPVLDDREVDPIVRSRCSTHVVNVHLLKWRHRGHRMILFIYIYIYIYNSGAAIVPRRKSWCYPPRGNYFVFLLSYGTCMVPF